MVDPGTDLRAAKSSARQGESSAAAASRRSGRTVQHDFVAALFGDQPFGGEPFHEAS
jgi:hypothetical protein